MGVTLARAAVAGTGLLLLFAGAAIAAAPDIDFIVPQLWNGLDGLPFNLRVKRDVDRGELALTASEAILWTSDGAEWGIWRGNDDRRVIGITSRLGAGWVNLKNGTIKRRSGG